MTEPTRGSKGHFEEPGLFFGELVSPQQEQVEKGYPDFSGKVRESVIPPETLCGSGFSQQHLHDTTRRLPWNPRCNMSTKDLQGLHLKRYFLYDLVRLESCRPKMFEVIMEVEYEKIRVIRTWGVNWPSELGRSRSVETYKSCSDCFRFHHV